MTMAEYKSNIRLTKNTPYLTLTGELWGVFYDDFGKIDQVIMALHCITMQHQGDGS